MATTPGPLPCTIKPRNGPYALPRRNDAELQTISGNAARTRHLAGDRERADALFEALTVKLPPVDKHSAGASPSREVFGEHLAAEGRPMAALPLQEGAVREPL